MRKTILLLIALFLFCSPSFALLKMGLKGGVNLADVTVSGSDVSYKIKPGFVGGLTAEIPVSASGGLAVRGELLYVQKGAEFTLLNESGKLSTDELVIAPFLVLRLVSPQITPFLEIGPEFGFNTLAKQQYGSSGYYNISSYWKKQNMSLNIGGGIEIPLGQNELSLDARYNLGLVDMSVGSGEVKTKTNGIQVLLGFIFLRF
jgi:hypothetical protein